MKMTKSPNAFTVSMWSILALGLLSPAGAQTTSMEAAPATPLDAKSGRGNPWIKKMRLNCEDSIRDADRLAAGAEKFAEFHAMRAAELQGK